MEKYIDKSIIDILKDINKFDLDIKTIQTSNVNDNTNNQSLINWLNKYVEVYHDLVNEFMNNKIKLIKLKINDTRNKHNLELLLINLLKNENYLKILENNLPPRTYQTLIFLKLNFDKIKTKNKTKIKNKTHKRYNSRLIKQKTKTKTNKSNNKSSNKTIKKIFNEWFNKYQKDIFSNENNESLLIQLDKFLEKNKNNPSYSSDIKFYKLLEEIIKELNLASINPFLTYPIFKEVDNGLKYTYSYNDNELSFKIHSNNKISMDNIYWGFLYARMKAVYKLYVEDKKEYEEGKKDEEDKKELKDRKLNFEIFLTEHKKELPNDFKIFNPSDVNSGSTDYKNIKIWRKEEHLKLILHETIHFFNIDNSYNLFEDKINLECTYQIADKTETRVYEALTETFTVFLNAFSNSYQIYYLENIKKLNTKMNNNNTKMNNKLNLERERIKEIFIDLFEKEKKFFIIQIAKIFIHINPNSNDFKDFIINPNKGLEECKIKRLQNPYKLEQTTSVLSYHILKGANVFYDLEFIKWIKDPLNPIPYVSKYIKSQKDIIEHIQNLTHQSNFIDIVNKAIYYLKHTRTHYNKNLRMTFYEMNLV